MDEHRLASRKRLMLPVRLQAKGAARWAETATEDVSARGFRCVMRGRVWPVGTSVSFEIPLLPDKAPFTGTARIAHIEQVAHSDQCSIGFSFSGVSADALHQLHVYLKESATRPEGHGEA